MAKITNVHRHGDLEVPLLGGCVVKAAETVNVDDEHARRLLAQPDAWAPADARAKKIAAALAAQAEEAAK